MLDPTGSIYCPDCGKSLIEDVATGRKYCSLCDSSEGIPQKVESIGLTDSSGLKSNISDLLKEFGNKNLDAVGIFWCTKGKGGSVIRTFWQGDLGKVLGILSQMTFNICKSHKVVNAESYDGELP